MLLVMRVVVGNRDYVLGKLPALEVLWGLILWILPVVAVDRTDVSSTHSMSAVNDGFEGLAIVISSSV